MKKQHIIFLAFAFAVALVAHNPAHSQGWDDSTPGVIWTTDNVGIGMASPPVPFAVIGDMGSSHPNAPRFLFQRTEDEPILWNFEAGAFVSQNGFAIADLTNVAQKLVIESGFGNSYFPTGGLGIGTTEIPDGYSLAVNGKVIAEEIKVQLKTNWPDFVFRPDYDLLSLNELESYISQNGHLPGVPTAEEVEENAINLGEMTTILLQKVEELTLYVIELQKENEKMQEVISRIE